MKWLAISCCLSVQIGTIRQCGLTIPRKKQQLIVANASQIEKLKAMHERYEQKFFTQNASKVLKNKDGKGLAYCSLKHRQMPMY